MKELDTDAFQSSVYKKVIELGDDNKKILRVDPSTLESTSTDHWAFISRETWQDLLVKFKAIDEHTSSYYYAGRTVLEIIKSELSRKGDTETLATINFNDVITIYRPSQNYNDILELIEDVTDECLNTGAVKGFIKTTKSAISFPKCEVTEDVQKNRVERGDEIIGVSEGGCLERGIAFRTTKNLIICENGSRLVKDEVQVIKKGDGSDFKF